MTPAIFFVILALAAIVVVFWDLIVFAAEPYLDAATRRTTTLRERSARAWADFKLGAVQKAAAGARLVKLMGAFVFTAPLMAAFFVFYLAGFLVGPVLWVAGNIAATFKAGAEFSHDASERFVGRQLDRLNW